MMEADSPSYWGEDNTYPSIDWRFEVSNQETRLGYWEWVKHQKLKEKFE